MRIFVAVELPADVRKKIGELIDQLKSAGATVKWVEEQNLHLTLKFIGEVADKEIDRWLGSIEEKVGGTGAFEIKLEGMGTFPEGKQPRVVWVGVSQGQDKLENLARWLDEKEFVSHATIGRIKTHKGVDKLVERVRSFKSSEFGVVRIDKILVMKSTLTPKGPVYEKIKDVIL
jgi:2'-5' RNA ligase